MVKLILKLIKKGRSNNDRDNHNSKVFSSEQLLFMNKDKIMFEFKPSF